MTSRPEARYGAARRRVRVPRWAIVVGAVAVLALVFGFSLLADRNKVSADVVQFNVDRSDLVTLDYSVVPNAERDIVCSAQALNQSFAIVGFRELRIPADPDASAERPVFGRVDIRTTQVAVNAGLEGCALVAAR